MYVHKPEIIPLPSKTQGFPKLSPSHRKYRTTSPQGRALIGKTYVSPTRSANNNKSKFPFKHPAQPKRINTPVLTRISMESRTLVFNGVHPYALSNLKSRMEYTSLPLRAREVYSILDSKFNEVVLTVRAR